MESILLLAQADLTNLKDLIAAAAIVPSIASFIIGMVILYFFSRLISRSMQPLFGLITTVNQNFAQVLKASEQSTERYDSRVEKHEEAMSRAFDAIEKLTTAYENNAAKIGDVGTREQQNNAVLSQLVTSYEAQVRTLNEMSSANATHLQLHSNTDLKIIGVQTSIEAVQASFQALKTEVQTAMKSKRDTGEMIVDAINTAQEKILAAIVPPKRATNELPKVEPPTDDAPPAAA